MKGKNKMNIMDEMFLNNKPSDDVALLANLLSQVVDVLGEPSVTAYDEETRTDSGICDVLGYVRRKYGEEFC
jgi:hypothetical protein